MKERMKVLAFIEEAAGTDGPLLFLNIESFIQFLKDDRNYNFPQDDDDYMILAKLQAGQDAAVAAYAYRWIEVIGS
jgi:hypothetical protein